MVLMGRAVQSVAADKHLQGWTASSNPPCSSGRPVERDSAGNCNPGTSAYVSADKNPWTGVTCNAAGKVTCIYLAALGIQGQLDGLADLSGLPSLAYLNLKSNKLTGMLKKANLFSQKVVQNNKESSHVLSIC